MSQVLVLFASWKCFAAVAICVLIPAEPLFRVKATLHNFVNSTRQHTDDGNLLTPQNSNQHGYYYASSSPSDGQPTLESLMLLSPPSNSSITTSTEIVVDGSKNRHGLKSSKKFNPAANYDDKFSLSSSLLTPHARNIVRPSENDSFGGGSEFSKVMLENVIERPLLSLQDAKQPSMVAPPPPPQPAEQQPEQQVAAANIVGTINLPLVVELDARCDDPALINIKVRLDAPFDGIIYAKGYYDKPQCMFVPPNSFATTFEFAVPLDSCGSRKMEKNDNDNVEDEVLVSSVTLMFQRDPLFQGKWDYARRIRCSWTERANKRVAYTPFAVEAVPEETMDFKTDDGVSVAMDVKVGRDPLNGVSLSREQPITIGTDMTVVIYARPSNSLQPRIVGGAARSPASNSDMDIAVRDCEARDSLSQRVVPLTDANGCVLQSKLITSFQVLQRDDVRNYYHYVEEQNRPLIAYAHLESFKFPDSPRLKLLCNVATCRGLCNIRCPTTTPTTIHHSSSLTFEPRTLPWFMNHNNNNGKIMRAKKRSISSSPTSSSLFYNNPYNLERSTSHKSYYYTPVERIKPTTDNSTARGSKQSKIDQRSNTNERVKLVSADMLVLGEDDIEKMVMLAASSTEPSMGSSTATSAATNFTNDLLLLPSSVLRQRLFPPTTTSSSFVGGSTASTSTARSLEEEARSALASGAPSGQRVGFSPTAPSSIAIDGSNIKSVVCLHASTFWLLMVLGLLVLLMTVVVFWVVVIKLFRLKKLGCSQRSNLIKSAAAAMISGSSRRQCRSISSSNMLLNRLQADASMQQKGAGSDYSYAATWSGGGSGGYLRDTMPSTFAPTLPSAALLLQHQQHQQHVFHGATLFPRASAKRLRRRRSRTAPYIVVDSFSNNGAMAPNNSYCYDNEPDETDCTFHPRRHHHAFDHRQHLQTPRGETAHDNASKTGRLFVLPHNNNGIFVDVLAPPSLALPPPPPASTPSHRNLPPAVGPQHFVEPRKTAAAKPTHHADFVLTSSGRQSNSTVGRRPLIKTADESTETTERTTRDSFLLDSSNNSKQHSGAADANAVTAAQQQDGHWQFNSTATNNETTLLKLFQQQQQQMAYQQQQQTAAANGGDKSTSFWANSSSSVKSNFITADNISAHSEQHRSTVTSFQPSKHRRNQQESFPIQLPNNSNVSGERKASATHKHVDIRSAAAATSPLGKNDGGRSHQPVVKSSETKTRSGGSKVPCSNSTEDDEYEDDDEQCRSLRSYSSGRVMIDFPLTLSVARPIKAVEEMVSNNGGTSGAAGGHAML